MNDDDELMESLRRLAAEADPVPDVVVDNGRTALLTRGLDAELAELLLDSALESAQVRGDAEQVRLLSFQFDDVSLEVQVEHTDGHVSVRGLVDGGAGAVDVDLGSGAGGQRTLPVDADGAFAARLPRGAARFRLRSHGGRLIMTSWLLL